MPGSLPQQCASCAEEVPHVPQRNPHDTLKYRQFQASSRPQHHLLVRVLRRQPGSETANHPPLSTGKRSDASVPHQTHLPPLLEDPGQQPGLSDRQNRRDLCLNGSPAAGPHPAQVKSCAGVGRVVNTAAGVLQGLVPVPGVFRNGYGKTAQERLCGACLEVRGRAGSVGIGRYSNGGE